MTWVASILTLYKEFGSTDASSQAPIMFAVSAISVPGVDDVVDRAQRRRRLVSQ
ncbi:hypothetical protein ACFQZZ_25460 [Nocardia sp. GCM10030253]|uniref:hypothetical protein n=1 Tax=Nocardia sp. GCM10030253 TaxID=3273404 RepID=UPI00363D231E